MTKERKYAVADALTTAFRPTVGNIDKLDSHVAFGIILNKSFKTKGKVQCLKDMYEFENASHITNLIIRRLKADEPVEVNL